MTRATTSFPSRFKLTFKDKVLLSLLTVGAVAEDILIEAADPFDIGAQARGYSLENINFFKERRKTLKHALFRLLKEKCLDKEKTEKEKLYKLTSAGLNLIFSKFPTLKYRAYHWDGFWRTVIYDIQETEKKLRQRLRTELRRLGFVPVQKSVWFSPLPVEKELEKFLRGESLWGRILLFKSLLPRQENERLKRIYLSQHHHNVNGIKNESGIKFLSQLFESQIIFPEDEEDRIIAKQ